MEDFALKPSAAELYWVGDICRTFEPDWIVSWWNSMFGLECSKWWSIIISIIFWEVHWKLILKNHCRSLFSLLKIFCVALCILPMPQPILSSWRKNVSAQNENLEKQSHNWIEPRKQEGSEINFNRNYYLGNCLGIAVSSW